MRTALLLFISLLASPWLMPGKTQGDSDVTLHVVAHDDGAAFWFEVEGYPGRNPALDASAGTEVTLHFENRGTVAHNFCFGAPVAVCNRDYPTGVAVGDTDVFIFRVPNNSTDLAYFCQPHESLGMKGHLVGPPVAGSRGLPGAPTILVSTFLLLVASLWRRA